MIWRVDTSLFFDIEDEARDYYHDSMLALAKAITINPGQENEEHSTIEWHRCSHNEEPSSPCVLIAHDQSP